MAEAKEIERVPDIGRGLVGDRSCTVEGESDQQALLDKEALTQKENLSHKEAYIKGVVLIVVSATVFSTVGLFVKGVTAQAWDIIFWRGLFSALFAMLWTLRRGAFQQNFLKMGKAGWAAAIIGAAGSAAFIPALKLTSIANVSLIYAAAPLLAALIAWVWIRERVSRQVFLASLLAMSGVGVIVWGSVGAINFEGDLLALCMTLAMAISMVIYRCFPATPAAGPMAVSSLLLLPWAFALGNPLAVPFQEFFILIAFGLVFAIAGITLNGRGKARPLWSGGAFERPGDPACPSFGLAGTGGTSSPGNLGRRWPDYDRGAEFFGAQARLGV